MRTGVPQAGTELGAQGEGLAVTQAFGRSAGPAGGPGRTEGGLSPASCALSPGPGHGKTF